MQFLYGDSPQMQVIYSNYQKKALMIVFNKSKERKCKEILRKHYTQKFKWET